MERGSHTLPSPGKKRPSIIKKQIVKGKPSGKKERELIPFQPQPKKEKDKKSCSTLFP